MTPNITTYYIPQNQNITSGKIYEIYLNKVTNLNLTSIIQKTDLTINGILQPNKEIILTQNDNIIIAREDYNNIINLAETTEKLYNQSQKLIKKLTKGSDNDE